MRKIFCKEIKDKKTIFNGKFYNVKIIDDYIIINCNTNGHMKTKENDEILNNEIIESNNAINKFRHQNRFDVVPIKNKRNF
jgi:hypothetical protein